MKMNLKAAYKEYGIGTELMELLMDDLIASGFETIKYEITVTNDGTQDMTDIVVKDALTGDEWKVDSLAAGKSKTFKAEYKVTEKDAAAGSVTNVATAEGNDPDGDKTPVVPGDVTTKTDKAPEGGIPKTGDTTPIVEYTAMLGAALGLLLMIIRRRKERA
jgi:LPXTG-motif cell wall-anchored protein